MQPLRAYVLKCVNLRILRVLSMLPHCTLRKRHESFLFFPVFFLCLPAFLVHVYCSAATFLFVFFFRTVLPPVLLCHLGALDSSFYFAFLGFLCMFLFFFLVSSDGAWVFQCYSDCMKKLTELVAKVLRITLLEDSWTPEGVVLQQARTSKAGNQYTERMQATCIPNGTFSGESMKYLSELNSQFPWLCWDSRWSYTCSTDPLLKKLCGATDATVVQKMQAERNEAFSSYVQVATPGSFEANFVLVQAAAVAVAAVAGVAIEANVTGVATGLAVASAKAAQE